MTRQEHIAKNRELGLPTDWLEALTDEQYENEKWDAYEKRAKEKN